MLFMKKPKVISLLDITLGTLKDFDEHIPKISRFWALQLLKLSKNEIKNLQEEGIPNQIIKKHIYLKIKKVRLDAGFFYFKKQLISHPWTLI